MARAQIEDASILWIDGKPFAIAASVFIGAELDGHIRPLKSPAAIRGAENRSVRRTGVGVGAAGQIQAVGIRRIDRNGFDAHQIAVALPDPVQQRLPAMACIVPAISTTDVGARIANASGQGMKDDAVDKAATDDLHVLPGVVFRRRHLRRTSNGGEHKQTGCTWGEVQWRGSFTGIAETLWYQFIARKSA